jgi:hypothetical protein
LLSRFVHGVFALATFNVLLCCLLRGEIVNRPLAPRVNHDKLGSSRLYALFVARGGYSSAALT